MILNILLMIVSVALIIVCLMQSGKSDGIVNALTGQSSNLFAHQKERRSRFGTFSINCWTCSCISLLLQFLLEWVKQIGHNVSYFYFKWVKY